MSDALHQEYQIGEELGRGRFGAVFRCYHPSSGESFACKTVDKRRLLDSPDPLDRDCLDKEPKIMLHLSSVANPHLLRLHRVFEDDLSLHLVVDLCGPTADLFDRLLRRPFSEPEAAAVMLPLMDAVAHCHRLGVAHRDLKPDNVLFDDRDRLKLADFGSAEFFGDGRPMSGIVGTPYYVAPEVLSGREYNEKVDVWSAGVILYVMLAGVPPFYGETAAEIFEAVMRGNLRFPTRIFHSVSSAAKDLIRKMICKDVNRRFSAEQVLMHPWFTSYGETRSMANPT